MPNSTTTVGPNLSDISSQTGTGAGTYSLAAANPAYTPGYTAPTTTSITSSSIAPSTPITPIQPATTPTYPVATLGQVTTPPLTETSGEQQQSSLYKQLTDLSNQDAGKAAYTTDQYKALGFGMTYDAQGNIIPDAGTQDLQAKLSSLKNEALAIPLQGENAAQGLRSEQGQAPLTAAATRTNAIQSLQVSSTIDAINGHLATAQAKVNQAIIQKYGPIEAQMAAIKANLENIKNDPQTTLEDKNRAQAQLDSVKAQEAQIAQHKQDNADIWKLATDSAANGANFIPSQQYPTLATALTAIQDAPDKATALAIASGSGLSSNVSKAQPTASIQEYEYAKKNGYKGTFSQYQDEDANRKQRSITPKAPTAAQTDTTNTVNNVVDGVSKLSDIPTTDANYENVKAQLSQLGFFSDTPPAWYVKSQNDKYQGNVLPTVLQAQWIAYKNTALGN